MPDTLDRSATQGASPQSGRPGQHSLGGSLQVHRVSRQERIHIYPCIYMLTSIHIAGSGWFMGGAGETSPE